MNTNLKLKNSKDLKCMMSRMNLMRWVRLSCLSCCNNYESRFSKCGGSIGRMMSRVIRFALRMNKLSCMNCIKSIIFYNKLSSRMKLMMVETRNSTLP